MIDIIGVGESDVDIFLKVDRPPLRGEKIRSEEIGKFPGGIIGNFCSAVVKNGLNCGIVSVIGDDENGKIALEDYMNRGVDLTGLTVKKNGQTFYCIVHIDSSGEKYLTAVVTPLISPEIEDIDFNYLKEAKYVHLTSMDYRLAYKVTKELKNTSTKVSLDYEAHAENGGFNNWKCILENVSLLFINEDGLKSIFPMIATKQAMERILELGVEMVVLTCAEKGGHVFTAQQHFSYKAFKPENIVDTTGAGDCFNAAFLSALLKSNTVEQAMSYAAAAAALSIQKVGARTGLPTSQEVESFLNTNPVKLL